MNDVIEEEEEEEQRQDSQDNRDYQDEVKTKVLEILQGVLNGRNSEVILLIMSTVIKT